MKIGNKTLDIEIHYLDRVTYVPPYVYGDAGHSSCERGVIISFDVQGVKVLYCKSRTVQLTDAKDLVWG